MPLNLKALIFILVIGSVFFWFAKRYSTDIVSQHEIRKWRNLWFIIQIIGFTVPNIWAFYSSIFLVCIFLIPKSPVAKIATYCFILTSVPLLTTTLSGFGITNYLFKLNFARALSLFILLPVFFTLIQHNSKQMRLFSQPADKFAIIFILLTATLDFRDDSITNGLRFTFLHFIDLFLPYYVISRSITTHSDLTKVLFALLLSISMSTSIAIFEAVKSWSIYNPLGKNLLDIAVLHSSDYRGGILRATATFVTPIALGYVITIGFGLYLYFSPLVRKKDFRQFVPMSLIIGLYVTVARGPWVGFAFLCLVYIWTGKEKLSSYFKLILGTLIGLPILLISGPGQKFIDLLPFIGTIRSDTIEYRERLLDMAIIVIQKNPVLGSTKYLETPEMRSMMQGEGIIDIVNSYIQITLAYGYLGLISFVSIFLVLLWNIYKSVKQLPKEEKDLIRLGRSLFSILSAVALIIYTVSSVDYIPYYYWMLFGLSTSYIYICKQTINQ